MHRLRPDGQVGIGQEATEKAREPMAAGTVKWFNDAKGFGFIQQDNGAQTSSATTFCHHTAINMQGFRPVSTTA
jgi:cold shock CspA family protein